MDLPDRPSPLQQLWLRNFPFTYWDNRINKISRYNSADRLEALYVMLQLVDIYAHMFAARAFNPHEAWFMVKEVLRWTSKIEEPLKKLQTEDAEGSPRYVDVRGLAHEPEGLVGFQQVRDDWEVDLTDWIAADFLGCPVRFDTERKEMVFEEDPEIHFAGASAILTYWMDNRRLLNDFKHGFRVLPFDADTVVDLVEMDYMDDTEEVDELLATLQETEASDDWNTHFIRMGTDEQDDHYDVSLQVFRVNLDLCVAMARMTLHQLHNLFGTGGDLRIEPSYSALVENEDDGAIEITTTVVQFDFEMYEPEARTETGSE